MENLAKQAKSSRLRLVESVRKMYNDISPLQDELNAMRAVIGIEPMAELENVPSPSELECVLQAQLFHPVFKSFLFFLSLRLADNIFCGIFFLF